MRKQKTKLKAMYLLKRSLVPKYKGLLVKQSNPYWSKILYNLASGNMQWHWMRKSKGQGRMKSMR